MYILEIIFIIKVYQKPRFPWLLQTILMLYSQHNGLILLHKYTSTEHWPEFPRVNPDSRDTITCNTTCIVDNSRYLTGLSANYCRTQFTCIWFLLLEYICFSIYLFEFPMSFFCQHHNTLLAILLGRSFKWHPVFSHSWWIG